MFFIQIILMPRARTSPHLPALIAVGVLGCAQSLAFAAALVSAPVLLSAGVGVLASLVYVFWYSRFGTPADPVLREGSVLPEFALRDGDRPLRTGDLLGQPALWIFYRGNWCPLCMAQIREVAEQYRELARRGVAVYVISPQPEANSAALAKKFAVPMRFLTDPGNRAAERLGIAVRGGLPAGFQVLGYGSDVPRPTVFITDAGGRLIYLDLTDNYRVRPEPSVFFSVLDRHAIV